MKNKIIKTLLSIAAVCCLVVSLGAIGVSAENAENVGNSVFSTAGDEGITPYTMYLSSGKISYQKPSSGTMRVTVTTSANSIVSSLYHDVVIYKNGTLVYSDRTTKSNSSILVSYEDFSAKEGDFFSTYVTHYVSNNGSTEHCDTHKDQTY